MFYQECLNPPIRGSIGTNTILALLSVKKKPQSPYKGFNSYEKCDFESKRTESLNPPIRGSIEQDNALFKDYNHKQ